MKRGDAEGAEFKLETKNQKTKKPEQVTVRIATYNMLKGGKKRVHWQRLIEEYSVDLLLVQESYSHEEHLPPLLYPNAADQSVWEAVGGNRWGSGVFSQDGRLHRVRVPDFAGWVVGAEIRGAAWQKSLGESIYVFSVHAPSRGQSYAKEVQRLLDELGRIAGRGQLVLGGDFNLSVSRSTHSGRPVSKADLAIQARLADEFDLINCWQAANPDQPLPQTLRWTRDPTIPYHCDGLFVPKAWQSRLRTCTIVSGEQWNALSDHNPVVATFA